MEDKKLLDKIEKKIIQILKKEGGAAGLAPLKKAVDKMDQPKDFDLKKTLKKMDKVEKHKESDYILTPINEKDDAAMKKSALGMAMYGKKAKMNEQDSLEVDVYGYQTKHFDVCPGAQSLYQRIVDEDLVKDKDLVTRTAKLHDALFALEKTALENGATELDVEAAQLMADQIMEMAKMMDLESEHQYVQGHVEKVKGAVKGEINEIEAKNNTTFKIKLKHLLQKHATNLKRGDDDTEFKLTLKHLLDKHVVKGGEEKAD